MSDELKKVIEETKNQIQTFRNEYSEAIKKGEDKSGELEAKLEKLSEEITKGMEKYNKLEFALNNNAQSNNEKDSKTNKLFNEFARKGEKEYFGSYLNKKYSAQELKDMTVNSDPDGGYVVLPQYEAIRQTRAFETSPMRQIANVMPISSDRLILTVDEDEAASGGWVAEQAPRPTTGTPQIKQIEIPVHEQYANPKASQKLLNDASIDIENWLARKVNDILGRTENTAFVSGNGIGKPKGFLTYAAWTTNDVYEFGKIEQVNTGSAGAFTSDGVIDLQNSLKEAYQARAVFVTKRKSFGSIIKLKDNEDNYLFNRALDKNTGRPFSLLNSPVVFFDDMPVVAANSLSLAYGDFNAGYQIVDRLGIMVLRDPYNSKPFVEFYTTKSTGGAVVNFEAIKIQKLAA